MAPEQPPVLVAVVSWNTAGLLDECLESLRPEARAGRATVWVVDNASSDGSADLVRERHPWVHLVASEDNLGFGRAVNLVTRRAEPGWSWVAPANADVELRPGALERMLEAGRADPQAGALAPRLVSREGDTEHSLHGFPTVPAAIAFALSLQRVLPRLGERLCFPGYLDGERRRRAPWAIAAFLLVRREAWDAVGGFDDSQFMYAEDLDLGWRLHAAGRPTRYVPDAVVRHESAAATSKAWGDARLDRAQAATYAWMLQRRGALLTSLVAAINTAGAGVRWAAFAVAARLAPRRYAYRRDFFRAWVRRHSVGVRPERAVEALER